MPRSPTSYSTPGDYTVSLTVTDDRGAVSTTTQNVTASLAANVLPTASFGKTLTNLSVAVDGSASKDPDGTIASYAWAFGDGGTASGVTASHEYAAPGVYTVVLTVTDNRGGSATSSSSVDVTVSNVIAEDGFDRTVANGWGPAVKGGTWSLSGTASRFAVGESAASLLLSTSATQGASLSSVASSSSRLSASFSVDKIASAQYISFIGRQVGTEQYLLRTRVGADGSVILNVMRGATAVGAAYTVPGLTIVPGATYKVIFDVTGTGPTALSAKVWRATDAEPGSWQVTRTDATASMQRAGSVGISSSVPTSANAYPVKVSILDFSVIDPAVTPTPQNQKPTATFAATTSNLSAAFDGSASSDPDGTISSFAWAFGDGATDTTSGSSSTHVYATPGVYTATLTVTDNRGAQSTTTKEVTATAPPVNQSPTAAFTSSASGLSLTVDGSTSADADGTIAGYAWTFGDGGSASGATTSHTFTASGTYRVSLTVTDDKGATSATALDVSVVAPPIPPTVLAQDLFERSGTGGWGSADQGGPWSITGSAARFAVESGSGTLSLTSSGVQQATLPSVTSTSTRLAATFSVDKVAASQYISFIGRQAGAEQYLLRLRVGADGAVTLNVMRGSTAIGSSYVVPGLTIAPGQLYKVIFDVTGTSPTNLSGKVWKAADPEPGAWQVTRTDSTAAAQVAGCDRGLVDRADLSQRLSCEGLVRRDHCHRHLCSLKVRAMTS